jgi:Uma2 family endonuclease
MANVNAALTYRDYAALPDDGRRYEIHDGVLSVTPAPGRRHQAVVIRLAATMHTHVTARGLGEVYVAPFDVILADTTVVQPDIVFVTHERLAIIAERGVEGPPTLAVEVISPSTVSTDRRIKLALYARHEVLYCWLVDPAARTIEAYRLDSSAYRLEATLGGTEPRALPPLLDLPLDPAALWP